MPGICLTFDNDTKQAINQIYQKINDKIGNQVLKIHEDLEPHFTLLYHSGNTQIPRQEIDKTIDLLSEKYKKRQFKIEGYGIFKREDNFILYLSTAYDTKFQEIHKDIWNRLKKYDWITEHYHFTSYVPHLTIPLINSNYDTAVQVLSELLKSNLTEITLNNSAISYLTGNYANPKVYYSKELI